MTNLEPRADKVVRDAVDAFMDGRLVPDFVGEIVFETKNSRYRLVNGVIRSAPDPSLVGAELVGWLCESQRRCLVESAWQPGARAVLVERAHDRNIVVTSTTQLLHADGPGSSLHQGRSVKAPVSFRTAPPRDTPTPLPSFAMHEAPIVAATPEPPSVASHEAPITATTHEPAPVVSAPIASAATPIASAPKRSGVHLPPRPIAGRPSPVPVPPRPLPMPLPPPRRDPQSATPSPPAEPQHSQPLPMFPLDLDPPADWEVTSAELEIVPEAQAYASDNSTRHAAPQRLEDADSVDVPFELSRPLDPANAEPFPLVRPLDPGPPSRR
ncbi:Hypothetical protein A7982_10886 [Minicystis rosea]|nr:Hypothetical protein A7982_10886 [Minicystis rosea]